MTACTCEFLMHHSGCEYDGPDITAPMVAVLRRLDGFPTPADGLGRCWFCGGELRHGPNGHKPDCAWTAMRQDCKRQTTESTTMTTDDERVERIRQSQIGVVQPDTTILFLLERLAASEAARSALAKAVLTYGDHTSSDCAPMYGCSCGLVEAMELASQTDAPAPGEDDTDDRPRSD